jgi:hypothetical protein
MPVSLTAAERRLVLLSAAVAACRQATAAETAELTTRVDWGRLREALHRRRLLPPLGPRIVELADGHADPGFRAAVDEAIEAGRRQAVLLQLVSGKVMTALAEVGIRSATLKGAHLAEAIYGDPGRRLAGDVDLLVEAGQLDAAVGVVRELGYAAPSDHVAADGLPQLHFALVHERRELPPVELHWRIHWYERSFAGECLLPPEPDPSGHWRPAAADELAALLLFYARDGFVDLRIAADIAAWWDARGDQLEAWALDDVVRRYPAFSRVVPAAARAAARTVALPARRILRDPSRDPRGRAAVRLANPSPAGDELQVFAEMGLIDGLLAPPGGLAAFVKRELLRPADVLAAQDLRADKRRLRSSFGYGFRLLIRWGVVGRYLLALRRLLNRPERVA